MLDDIDNDLRFRLEDLTTDFDCFERLANLMGATFVNPRTWNQIRGNRINAFPNSYPDPVDWTEAQNEIFWSQCGDTMLRCGYGKELGI